MRRIAGIAVALVAGAVVLATGAAAGGDDGAYEVRAIFDNAAFLVEGEEVRVAGATVGTVAEVEVTMTDEAVHADGRPEPGKAAVVLRIDDPGFHDFRADAACLIRPQSLLGEKFVECEPTQPRAAATAPPPPLEEIPDGEAGAGQRLLPLESNGKAVDLDLVNDIMREPYADRFRLILNDLGAGLAARGEELAEIVERSNPALRETDEVLAILARQNRTLAALASDGDAVLAPLARERERISGFINEAETTAAATATRGADLEEGLAKLPPTLRELRLTMGELERFADAGTPTFAELGAAAPAATRATRALEPFADSATGALRNLAGAAEETQQPLLAADPVIRDLRRLGRSGDGPAKDLSKVLRTLRKGDGTENLLRFVYRAAGTFNGFDSLGHFLRAFLLITNCNDYVTSPQTGCIANFLETTAAPARARTAAGVGRHPPDAPPDRPPQRNRTPASRWHPGGDVPRPPPPATGGIRDARALLDFAIGGRDQ
ncbi:MAG: MlaD family protein [Solirubrobacterales bacterium]